MATSIKIPSLIIGSSAATTGIDTSVTSNSGNLITSGAVSTAISNLGSIYKVKGSKTWTQLLALASASEGDVYNVTDSDAEGSIGANYVCIKAVTSACTTDNYTTYWDKVGGIPGEATKSTSGLMSKDDKSKMDYVYSGTVTLTLTLSDGTTKTYDLNGIEETT